MLKCYRSRCDLAAQVGLGYDLRNRRAWLFDATGPDRLPPGVVLMCTEHAAEFRVPIGWEFTDERNGEPELGFGSAERAATTVTTPAAEMADAGGEEPVDVAAPVAQPADVGIAGATVDSARVSDREVTVAHHDGQSVSVAATVLMTQPVPAPSSQPSESRIETGRSPLLERAFRASRNS